MKQSINRYCKYSNEDVSSLGDYEEIYQSITGINDFVSVSSATSNDLSETFDSMYSQHLIRPSDYKLCKKLSNDIDELVERINSISWDEKILKSISAQKSGEQI